MTEPNYTAQIEADQRRMRREVTIRRVLYALRSTIQIRGLTPDTPVNDTWADFTDESVNCIAPLIEAVEVLEAIIFTSDGCVGHRQCAHSMEPWERARLLLRGKWDAEMDPDAPSWPPSKKTNS